MDRAYERKIRRKVKHIRVRKKVHGTEARPRLCVYRSLNNIFAQIIDDDKGVTLAAVNSTQKEVKERMNEAKEDMKTKMAKSWVVGKILAEKAKENGIETVVFDRGGYKYHGRVAKLAEAAREGGLKF